ncbi:MAG: periplasmic binding protein-like I [Podila humilis]|nr:MAG: periplasmic binding protein-like I [Podila humilis]
MCHPQNNSGISAVIGDYYSWTTEYSATLTSALRIPQCSFTAISDSLSNNLVYGTFIRSISANDMIFRQYLSYIQMMGWRRISVIFSDDSLGRSASLVISDHAAEYGVHIINSYSLQEYYNQRDLRPQLNSIRDTGSYVNLILANGHYLVRALADIQKAGMFGAPYVWLTMNDVNKELAVQFRNESLPQPNWDGLVVASVVEGFQKTSSYYNFKRRWESLDPAEYPGAGPNSTSIYIELRAYVCVWLLALGYQKDIELAKQRGISDAHIKTELQQGSYPRTVGNLTSVFFSTLAYNGPVGLITLDQHGNTNSTPILIYQRQDDKLARVARADVERNETYSSIPLGKHVWPGWPQDTVIPYDAPDWVFQNVSWNHPFGQTMEALVILGVGLSVGLIFLIAWKRKNPVILSAGPAFCVIELFAIIVIFGTVAMNMGVFKDWECITLPLALSFGLSLLIGTLTVKNLRQYRLYNNVLHDHHLKYDRILILQLAVIILFSMVPSITYVLEVIPRARFVNFEGKEAIICVPTHKGVTEKTDKALAIVCALPMTFMTMATAILAHRTRDMHVRWNESFGISCSMYNIIISNMVLTSAMFVSIFGLFGTKIVYMIRLASQRSGAARCRSSNSISSSAESLDVSSDHNMVPSVSVEDQMRIDAALQQFGFISTGKQKGSHSLFGRQSAVAVAVRPKKIRRYHTPSGARHRRPPVFASAPGGPETVAYTSCTLYEPYCATTAVPGWQLDASETRSDTGLNLESGVDPQQESRVLLKMSNEEAIAMPVMIERNRWYDHLVRKWRSMQVFVMPSLSVIILADCNENFIETCVYTDISSLTQAGHNYLYISCLRHIGLKLEFPTEQVRDQWRKSLVCCDHTGDHTGDHNALSTNIERQ